ncbi:VOC family protein [Candidatus Methylacidithermus pantelleriae]|uniref:Glyoxalase n=1 Tax=Candidatus Methylacidithermus pantelleriae TaxID=2744239 RepID=A0A8J2FQF7_9BACT|nr:VOC family protein [Candidatus Methylacidithermus pantelleriae]CAF0698610.1 Glyoxalase [Candidatus Methylacidithermus pantelleriae]
MVRNFDHVTLVVQDVTRAKAFFEALGFQEVGRMAISGEPYASYMGLPAFEADHISLALSGRDPNIEVQLLHFRVPEALPDPWVRTLVRLGFNHVCFEVDDIEKEVARLKEAGFFPKNALLRYQERKLIFIEGPEGVTIELSERLNKRC